MMVHKDTIERIRTEVAGCADETLEQEFEQFFRNQPEICDFVMDVASSSSQTVRELALYLSYVSYKAMVVDTGLADPIGEDAIVDACRRSQDWIQRISELDREQFEDAPSSEIGDEPYLLGFVVAEVQDAIADGLDLNDEEKGTVFFVLKTVISSMTAKVA